MRKEPPLTKDSCLESLTQNNPRPVSPTQTACHFYSLPNSRSCPQKKHTNTFHSSQTLHPLSPFLLQISIAPLCQCTLACFCPLSPVILNSNSTLKTFVYVYNAALSLAILCLHIYYKEAYLASIFDTHYYIHAVYKDIPKLFPFTFLHTPKS